MRLRLGGHHISNVHNSSKTETTTATAAATTSGSGIVFIYTKPYHSFCVSYPHHFVVYELQVYWPKSL